MPAAAARATRRTPWTHKNNVPQRLRNDAERHRGGLKPVQDMTGIKETIAHFM
jgi:hypothetical protein